MLQELLLIALIISLFCVGLRIISSPDMIFYILRQPYEWAVSQYKALSQQITEGEGMLDGIKKFIEESNETLSRNDISVVRRSTIVKQLEEAYEDLIITNNTLSDTIHKSVLINVLVYVLKPIIGCATCMASVWTFVIAPFLFSVVDYRIIITALVVAALNSIFMSLFELMEAKKKSNCK